jgi:PiT family inorganic phosphate transporter
MAAAGNGGNGDVDADADDVPVSREEIARRRLVRRAHVMTIATAWVTTVPASAILAAGVFLLLRLLA